MYVRTCVDIFKENLDVVHSSFDRKANKKPQIAKELTRFPYRSGLLLGVDDTADVQQSEKTKEQKERRKQ